MVLKFFLKSILVISTLASTPAAMAQLERTRSSLQRMEETLKIRMEEGLLQANDLSPMLVVSLKPAFVESRESFGTSAIEALGRTFSNAGIRMCEGCMVPLVQASGTSLEQRWGPLSLEEIRVIDTRARGDAPAAVSAVWIDETTEGVAIRILDLRSGRVLYAENSTPDMAWQARTEQNFNQARILSKRIRGESITHAFVDMGMWPGQAISLDWSEQWGPGNEILSGLSLSLFAPVLGLGPNFGKIFPEQLNSVLGAKLLLSVPNAIINSISDQAQNALEDPLFTLVGYARVPIPIGGGNYGLFLSASTAGTFTVGVSALNFSLLPVLP